MTHDIKFIGTMRLNVALLGLFYEIRDNMTQSEVNAMRRRNKAVSVRDAVLPPPYEVKRIGGEK